MRVLTQENSRRLLADCADLIAKAGAEGVLIAGLDPVYAYLAGVLSVEGRVAIVTRGDMQFFVRLRRRAKNPPVFREE